MSQFKKNLRFIKFIIVGIGYNALAYTLYSSLVYLHCHYLIASTVSYLFGVTISYFMNKKIVFGSQQKSIRLLLYYVIYYLFLLGATLFLLHGLVSWYSINPYVAQIIISTISALISYHFTRILFLRVNHGLPNTTATGSTVI